jgi:hypothetical protein
MTKGFPVILINKHFDNITSFLETINQTVVILFDEFEKNYLDHNKSSEDEPEGQYSLLNLFDAALSSKKLFLLTCNDVDNISFYLLNRPGRIHYHFKSQRLSIDEITAYCKDNLPEKKHQLIPDICSLGARIPDFSYDMIKALLFELTTYDCNIEEAKRVLNIEAHAVSLFEFTVYFKSGLIETGSEEINPISSRSDIDWFRKIDGKRDRAFVNMSKAMWSGKEDGSLFLDGSHVHWSPENEKTNDRIDKIIFVPARFDPIFHEHRYD